MAAATGSGFSIEGLSTAGPLAGLESGSPYAT